MKICSIVVYLLKSSVGKKKINLYSSLKQFLKYTTKFPLQVVPAANDTNNMQAAKHFGNRRKQHPKCEITPILYLKFTACVNKGKLHFYPSHVNLQKECI